MYNIGRDKIRKQLGKYIKELKEEYSKGLILPKKGEQNDDIQNTTKNDGISTYASGFNKNLNKDITTTTKTTKTENDINKNKEQQLGCKLDVKTLKLKVNFQCRSNELYDALTKTELVTAFTQGPVKMDVTKGGE